VIFCDSQEYQVKEDFPSLDLHPSLFQYHHSLLIPFTPSKMSQEDLISFNRVTIVGPGLLGASIAMSLKKKGIAGEIWVWLRNKQKKELCDKSEWCDRALVDLQDAVSDSDLVILCTPVELILDQLTTVSDWLKPGCIVTDVGSLKKGICQRADEVFRDKQIYFVGSHPMAGSEKTGMKYASPSMLEKKNCIVTPTDKTNSKYLNKISRMWKMLEMKVTHKTPDLHDEIVGWISHLPHLIASVLINTVGEKDPTWMDLSGNGLKDTTRIASGNPTMWKEILIGNRKNLNISIEHLIENLNDMKVALASEDSGKINKLLDSAKIKRDQLNDN
jgi:cyclohexadieny/prephenate dehydrogenase